MPATGSLGRNKRILSEIPAQWGAADIRKNLTKENVEMIGVILCSHASFAQGLFDAAEMITGEAENVTVLPFVDGDNVDELVEKLRAAAEAYRAQGLPYVYMVDLWGASPFNASLMAEADNGADIVAGVSLPFLLEFLTSRDEFKGGPTAEFLDGIIEEAGLVKRINFKELNG